MQAAAESAVTKSAQVCLPCKSRHRRCDWEDSACTQCRSAGLECLPQPTLKFRYHEKQKALSRASPSVWRPCPLPPVPIRFYDETSDVRAHYRENDSPRYSNTASPFQDAFGQYAPMTDVTGDAVKSSHVVSLEQDALHQYQSATDPIGDGVESDYVASQRQDAYTPSEHSSNDLLPLNSTEALLLRNFTDRMALWTDVADPFRTFETSISRLALTDPIVRSAICAFSARHFYRCQEGEDGDREALHYQNLCLNLLIPSMSGNRRITASVLTAVALLRQNEEMDEQDNRFHLEGASRILNTVPDFASLGGIGEAACWLCLREDIYVSLTMQTPIRTNIDCFLDSASIRRRDDQSWASLSIINLAFLLNRAFREPKDSADFATSEAELASWQASIPPSYRPIFYQSRSRKESRCFPEVWMLAPYHAVGLQYYHIAQTVLNAVKPQKVSNPYDSIPDARARAKRIRHHLYVIFGLAMSNERAENTWFTARHCLSVWGSYFHHEDDQLVLLEFLEKWRRRSGWKTSALVESLRRQWNENSDDDE